jgi:hypothetical protein
MNQYLCPEVVLFTVYFVVLDPFTWNAKVAYKSRLRCAIYTYSDWSKLDWLAFSFSPAKKKISEYILLSREYSSPLYVILVIWETHSF